MSKGRYSMRIMSILMILTLVLSLITPVSAQSLKSEGAGKLKNTLDEKLLQQFEEEDYTQFLVVLHEQVDTETVANETKREARLQDLSFNEVKEKTQKEIVNKLMIHSKETQSDIQSFLQREEKKGNVKEYHSYFIVNGFSITGNRSVAEQLQEKPEVKSVILDEKKQLQPIDSSKLESHLINQQSEDEIEWHVDRINAPDVWEKGITGEGIVVANIDSGVDVNHPALKSKYRGYDADNPEEMDHEFNWFDPASGRLSPMDSNGHGTHTMGTMVGQEVDGSNKIGVAPGAKWISARAFFLDEAYDSDLLASGEWVLAPTDGDGVPHPEKAPDVVNNSWGGNPYNNDWFRPMVKAWRAAGIVPIFSVGNASLFSPATPGSASAPANYPESIAVGATDANDDLASFSLGGPTEKGDIKPDLVAPGVDIRSSYPGETWDTFEYATESGTSMAAPQVAATVALMKQVDETLTVDEIDNTLKLSTVTKIDDDYPEAPNNGYGHGMLDALAAVEDVEKGIGAIEGQVTYKGTDHEAPTFEHDERKVFFEERDGHFDIRAMDNISVNKVVLSIQLDDGSMKTYEAERVKGDHLDGIYEVIVPAADIHGSTFSYWWEITDFGGKDTVSEVIDVDIELGVKAGYSQDFESYPEGWYSYGRHDSWEWGKPEYGPNQAASGEKVMGTQLRGEYEMDSDMTLVMPPVIVEEGTNLNFKQWYSLSWFGHDKGKVLVSIDGENWDEIYRITSDNENWHNVGLDLSDYAGEKVFIGFNLTSMDNEFPGWYIDDVQLLIDGGSNSSNITGSTENKINKTGVNHPGNFIFDNSETDLLPVEATIKVKETGWTTKADPKDGKFFIYHPPGDYTLEIQKHGFKQITQKVTLTKRGLITPEFTLESLPRQSINGEVSDPIGDGISDASLLFSKDGKTTSIKSGSDGTFSINLLEGSHKLTIFADGYYSDTQELDVVIGEDQNINVTLDRFYSSDPSEISYDNGSYGNNLAYGSAGSGFAVKMSLSEGETSALVTGAKLQFWADHVPVPGGDDILIEVYDANGENGSPGSKLGGPVEAKAKRDLYNWTEVDLSHLGIVVDDDFYIVYLQADDFPYVPGFVTDGDENNAAGRSWDYFGGHWFKASESYGNYMIRANVDYGAEAPEMVQPVIASPDNDTITNETSVTVNGTATPETSMQIKNNSVVGEVVEVDMDGHFSAEVELDEGENDLTAVSLYNDEPYVSSEVVFVIRDTTFPELTIDSPAEGYVTNEEIVKVEGTAIDQSLDEVTINGEPAAIENETYSGQVTLVEGENLIEVVASDKAGNKTEKSVTVVFDQTTPVIENLLPDTDQYVTSNDKVEITFESIVKGGEASFIVMFPAQQTTQTVHREEMEEVEEGLYKGTWTVPTNTNIEGAVIEVQLTNEVGNKVIKEAAGKLYIYKDQIERVSGKLRYDTAIETSKAGWTEAGTVVLARGDHYADALAGVPLAHKHDAPILLTRPTELYEGTLNELKRLDTKNVIVLGGSGAISDDVISSLENENMEVERINGETRYETAALIAESVAPEGTNEAVVASGVNFPDALSIASHAANEGLPILLTRAESLPQETENILQQLGVTETLMIGGTTAISSDVESLLPNAERLYGDDRFETNIEIANYFNLKNEHMYIATGREYADALTGAVLAAKNDSTILLVKDELPNVVADYITTEDIRRLTVFGGSTAVSHNVVNEIEKLLK